MINVGLEQQQQIRGADGTLLWLGAQVVATSYICTVALGNVGVGAGEAVFWDGTNSTIPRQETTAAGATPSADLPMSLALFCQRTPAATGQVNLFGVALEPAGVGGTALTTAKKLLVAGEGSIVGVQTTATLLSAGDWLSSSATAGLVAKLAIGASYASAIVLGCVFKINQVASPGTGSTGWAGVLVRGGSPAIS